MQEVNMKQNRLEQVIRGMEAMGLEQIIVSAPASVFYLTGTWVPVSYTHLDVYKRQALFPVQFSRCGRLPSL